MPGFGTLALTVNKPLVRADVPVPKSPAHLTISVACSLGALLQGPATQLRILSFPEVELGSLESEALPGCQRGDRSPSVSPRVLPGGAPPGGEDPEPLALSYSPVNGPV